MHVHAAAEPGLLAPVGFDRRGHHRHAALYNISWHHITASILPKDVFVIAVGDGRAGTGLLDVDAKGYPRFPSLLICRN